MPNPVQSLIRVRDYECDLQGIVNNAVYANYLEHARHEWLRANNIDFKVLHQVGLDLVVTRLEMDFRASLVPNDDIIVTASFTKESKLRWLCKQDIYKGEQLILNASVWGTCLDKSRGGRPSPCPEMDAVL